MLAAEQHTLPVSMRQAVITFLDLNETWLEAVLAQGRAEGSLSFSGPPLESARLIVGGPGPTFVRPVSRFLSYTPLPACPGQYTPVRPE